MDPMRDHRFVRTTLAAVCGVVLSVALVSLARAGEETRGDYREAVEPICKANTQANERIFAGVKQEIRGGKLGPAASRFTRAARALEATVREMKVVPPPPADRSRLSRWLGKVSVEASLFEAIAAKLRAGQKAQAEHLVVKLTNNANQANNAVIAFEFEYCRFEPARFT